MLTFLEQKGQRFLSQKWHLFAFGRWRHCCEVEFNICCCCCKLLPVVSCLHAFILQNIILYFSHILEVIIIWILIYILCDMLGHQYFDTIFTFALFPESLTIFLWIVRFEIDIFCLNDLCPPFADGDGADLWRGLSVCARSSRSWKGQKHELPAGHHVQLVHFLGGRTQFAQLHEDGV